MWILGTHPPRENGIMSSEISRFRRGGSMRIICAGCSLYRKSGASCPGCRSRLTMGPNYRPPSIPTLQEVGIAVHLMALGEDPPQVSVEQDEDADTA